MRGLKQAIPKSNTVLSRVPPGARSGKLDETTRRASSAMCKARVRLCFTRNLARRAQCAICPTLTYTGPASSRAKGPHKRNANKTSSLFSANAHFSDSSHITSTGALGFVPRTMSAPQPPAFACSTCGRQYQHSNHLRRHEATRMPSSPLPTQFNRKVCLCWESTGKLTRKSPAQIQRLKSSNASTVENHSGDGTSPTPKLSLRVLHTWAHSSSQRRVAQAPSSLPEQQQP
jgi:hypothetical protein